jgi:murein DD-endopeptidase MepM/ murein hydrolase activator NlpD
MKINNKKLIIGIPLITFTLILIYSYCSWTFVSPVLGSNQNSYAQNAFGAPRAGHKHKGVDIFAKAGTPVISASKGIVIYTGVLSLGGNVVVVLGPAFKTHYYAHLKEIQTQVGSILTEGTKIGTVGNTGNAKNTPAHLHYSIGTIIPRWINSKPDALSFYTNPVPLLNNYFKYKKELE